MAVAAPAVVKPRPVWQIDRDLARIAAALATCERGDMRWWAAMTRADKLLDERLRT